MLAGTINFHFVAYERCFESIRQTLTTIIHHYYSCCIFNHHPIISPHLNNMDSRRPRTMKRKLDQDQTEKTKKSKLLRIGSDQELVDIIPQQLDLLNLVFSNSDSDRASARSALNVLYQLSTEEFIAKKLVNFGAIPIVVNLLRRVVGDEANALTDSYKHDVQKGCASVLGCLAIKLEYQQLIVDAGALPYLVDILKKHQAGSNSEAFAGLLRRVADAITSLAHDSTNIKNIFRMEGSIPLLVELLELKDVKVRRAAAVALRTLAYQNDDNKNQIVVCNALPTLVQMLQAVDSTIHCEAVGVIGNLVHSSPEIKKKVLLAGALQPVICLLSSCCLESKSEAALLLGQFAASDSDCKVHIAQRGAIKPLVEMLKCPDANAREMSTFTLGRLAQDSHNQAGIAFNGGIEPLLNLVGSKNGSISHNAAFSLYGLADCEDNVADIIKTGGFKKLRAGHSKVKVAPTKECIAKTLTRLAEKMQGRVLKHMLYLMQFAEKDVQRHVSLALAHLCSPKDLKTIFIDNNGLRLLLELFESSDLRQRGDASEALHKLATKATPGSLHAAPTSPTPQVYLSEEFINNPKHSDVTFLVEGKSFYAHRESLLSSDIFRAMFDGGYKEKEAKSIEIPNIKWDVFELMMRFIYTGTADVNLDIAADLLKAADQYLLDGLKRLCEYALSQGIAVENISTMYHMSEDFNATSLRHACIMFVLEQFDKLSAKPWYFSFVGHILPDIRLFLSDLLTNPHSADS